MFDFSKDTSLQPKCHVTHGLLSRYVDTNQLPRSKRPYSTILNQYWSHSIDLLLPENLYSSNWKQVQDSIGQYEYSKVTMPLSQLLQGDFFNTYIKAGNISMLSDGRAGVDNLYTLREGILRLELPKEVYERAGLVGKPVPDGGRKHIKTRYFIEINLREPSMVRGKKGFDRIVWACKNVLSDPVTWLFFDHNSERTLESGTIPISLLNPTRVNVEPVVTHHNDISIPPFDTAVSTGTLDDEDAIDVLEWIGLVTLESPRIRTNDSIDPFLCRYQVPDHEKARSGSVVSIRWHGFMQGEWVRQLFIELLSSVQKTEDEWFALSAHNFRTEAVDPDEGYTVLCLPKAAKGSDGSVEERGFQPEYISWEMASANTFRS